MTAEEDVNAYADQEEAADIEERERRRRVLHSNPLGEERLRDQIPLEPAQTDDPEQRLRKSYREMKERVAAREREQRTPSIRDRLALDSIGRFVRFDGSRAAPVMGTLLEYDQNLGIAIVRKDDGVVVTVSMRSITRAEFHPPKNPVKAQPQKQQGALYG